MRSNRYQEEFIRCHCVQKFRPTSLLVLIKVFRPHVTRTYIVQALMALYLLSGKLHLMNTCFRRCLNFVVCLFVVKIRDGVFLNLCINRIQGLAHLYYLD